MSDRLTYYCTIHGKKYATIDYLGVIERLNLPIGTKQDKDVAVNMVNTMVAEKLAKYEDDESMISYGK